MAQKPKKTRRFSPLGALILIALCVLLLTLVLGDVVSVVLVDLPLRDLPQSFDGVTILYISDIHMTALCPPSKIERLMDQLARIKPDILLLGGDYTGNDILGRVISQSRGEPYGSRQTAMRETFFKALAGFEASLGKYAVPGDLDNELELNSLVPLSNVAEKGGVELLRDKAIRIEKGGQSIVLVGVDDWRTGIHDVTTPAQNIRSGDCAIVLTHSPEAVPQLLSRPGDDGGEWMDAALTGHTLGGLIRIMDYEVFNPLYGDDRYSSGWHMLGGATVLVGQGLNGSFLPLRLGTSPQVYVITLRRL